jgi:hypothetical protein
MRGYVFVGPQGLKSAAQLRRWLKLCGDAGTLPAKSRK